jgi:acetyl-CoA synthetase
VPPIIVRPRLRLLRPHSERSETWPVEQPLQAIDIAAKAADAQNPTNDVGSNQASYPPSALFAAQANAGKELCERAAANRLKFWADEAHELLWDNDFGEVLDWSNPPFARWFVGGTINVAVNCVDRHVNAGNGDRVAIHWVGEFDGCRDITYRHLQRDVSKAANHFTRIGLSSGDRVAIYMPPLPEAIVAMLACARLGLVHVVVSLDSPAPALRSRVIDSQAKVVITSDGQYRQGLSAPVKSVVDEALRVGDGPCESVEEVIVVRRTAHDLDLEWVDGRDAWWHDTVEAADEHHAAQPFDADHPLFLLYVPDTDDKLNGIVHSSGGYLTQVRYTFHYVFDHKEGRDVFWCDAHLGCIAGHYMVYGALTNGATSVIFEGAAKIPDQHRHFQIIENYGVTVYCAAPSLINAFMKWGREIPDAHDLSSLRLLGGMGQPPGPEAWQWYREVIGGGNCPIVDTWWQPETGAVMIAPLPGLTAAKPGSPTNPVPGISAHIINEHDDLVGLGEHGRLVVDRPWPSMIRGIWGDEERFVETYWSHFGRRGWYVTGVDARYDEDDAIWVLGHSDELKTRLVVGPAHEIAAHR